MGCLVKVRSAAGPNSCGFACFGVHPDRGYCQIWPNSCATAIGGIILEDSMLGTVCAVDEFYIECSKRDSTATLRFGRE